MTAASVFTLCPTARRRQPVITPRLRGLQPALQTLFVRARVVASSVRAADAGYSIPLDSRTQVGRHIDRTMRLERRGDQHLP